MTNNNYYLVSFKLIKFVQRTPTTFFSYGFVAGVGPGIFMVLASYAEHQKTLAVSGFCMAMLCMGVYYPSLKVNPIDLAPNYAGTLTAFANGIGSLAGVVGPTLAGYLTPDVSWT